MFSYKSESIVLRCLINIVFVFGLYIYTGDFAAIIVTLHLRRL